MRITKKSQYCKNRVKMLTYQTQIKSWTKKNIKWLTSTWRNYRENLHWAKEIISSKNASNIWFSTKIGRVSMLINFTMKRTRPIITPTFTESPHLSWFYIHIIIQEINLITELFLFVLNNSIGLPFLLFQLLIIIFECIH